MGLSSSFVSKVINGKKNVSTETIQMIASRLKLEDQTYEDLSAHLTQNKDLHFEEINIDQFSFISDWYHYALLELVTLESFKSDVSWISNQLGISEEKTNMAINRLARLGLIKIDKKGKITTLNKNLTNAHQPVPASAHTEHERQLLKKALEALDDVPKAERSQSSMTMAIPSTRLIEARKKIKQFQRDMTLLMQRKGTRNTVYNLSISFYPLTKTNTKNRS